MRRQDANPATARRIIEAVCKEFQVSRQGLAGRRGPVHLADARHAAFFLLRAHSGASHHSAVGLFGRKDHNTSVQSVRRAKTLREVDQSFAAHLDNIERELNGGTK